jgi:hypothetical protein
MTTVRGIKPASFQAGGGVDGFAGKTSCTIAPVRCPRAVQARS